MVDKSESQEIFLKALDNALKTERQQHFRLCVDEKDNISVANLPSQWSGLSGELVSACPTNTRKIIDVLITTTKKL